VVKEVRDDAAAVLCVAAAEADANEDPTLGGCGSGVTVVCSVSQLSPSGLRLLLRSPKPSVSTIQGLAPAGGASPGDKGKSSRKALLCLRMRDQTVD
jgi:hypothetical protein